MSIANPTPTMLLEQQIDGTNANTWNDRFNANWQRIDAAVNAVCNIDVTNADTYISTADSSDLTYDAQIRYTNYAVSSGSSTIARGVFFPVGIPKANFIIRNWGPAVIFVAVTGQTARPAIQLYPDDSMVATSDGTQIYCSSSIMGDNGIVRMSSNAFRINVSDPTGSPITNQVPGLVYTTAFGLGIYMPGHDGGGTPLILGVDFLGGAVFAAFEVAGTAAVVGSITLTGTGNGIAFNTSSDYRLKISYGDADTGAMIDAIPVHDAAFKVSPHLRQPMVMAHELQMVAPWAVTGVKDAVGEAGTMIPQMVDHASLVPMLLAEVKALRCRVAALEARA